MGSQLRTAPAELQDPEDLPGPDKNNNGGPMCQFTDRFYSAVRTLAGDGAVKQRLIAAYKDNLESLPDADVPDSIRERFSRLRATLSEAESFGNECAVFASVRKMSAADATALATDIVAMFSELVRARSTGERVTVSPSADRHDKPSSVPPHVALN